MLRIDADAGRLDVAVEPSELDRRDPAVPNLASSQHGCGRELFALFRRNAGPADLGGSVFGRVE